MSAVADIRSARTGHREPTRAEIVRQLQQATDRLSMSFNGWTTWPATDLAIGEAINSTLGMANMLRQLRTMTDAQK